MKKLTIADAVGLVSVAAAGIICVSLAYEYGFSRGAGLSLGDLSLSVQDFTKSAAAWAPSLFLGFLGIFVLEATTSFVEGGRSEEEIVERTRNPGRWRRIRNSPDYLFLAQGLFLLGALLTNASFVRPIAHLVWSLVWMALVGFLVTRESLRRKFPPRLLFSIWAIVGIVLFVYGKGKQDAILASKRTAVDVVELASGKSSSGVLLRRYSDFALFAPADGHSTMIIPSGEIRTIKRANQSSEPTASGRGSP